MAEPSFSNGFASPWYGGRMKYPGLWRGCVGSWSPLLGPTGATLFDQSGYANHGTLTNMDPATDWVVDRYGHAMDFDATNDHVSLITPTALSTTGPQSVSIWFRLNGMTVANRPTLCIYSLDGSPYTSQFAMGFNISGTSPSEGTGRLNFIAFNVSGDAFVHGAYTTRDFSSDTNWHHAVGMWTGIAWRIFIDGVEDTNADGTQIAPSTSAANLAIGGSRVSTSRALNGKVSEVQVFHRALSPNEITLLAQRPGIMYEIDDDDVWGAVEAGGATTVPWYYYAQQQVAA